MTARSRQTPWPPARRRARGRSARVVLAACAWLAGCGDAPPPPPEQELAGALAVAVEAALASAPALVEPYRCAALVDLPADARAPARTVTAAGRSIAIEGNTATAGGALPLILGVVADARVSRGTEAQSRDGLDALARAFADARVELVVSLGGMGRSYEEIRAALAAFARKGDDGAGWLTVAMPGDREDIEAHRRAIADLAADGAAIVDGAAVRFVVIDGAVVATFPGAAHRARLASGARGCVYDAADIVELARELASRSGVRVWASHAPVRQPGPDAGDLGAGAVHIGDAELARAIAASGATLAVHGTADWAALGPPEGRGKGPVVLGVGAADPVPLTPTGADRAQPVTAGAGLVVTIARDGVRWRRIRARR